MNMKLKTLPNCFLIMGSIWHSETYVVTCVAVEAYNIDFMFLYKT